MGMGGSQDFEKLTQELTQAPIKNNWDKIVAQDQEKQRKKEDKRIRKYERLAAGLPYVPKQQKPLQQINQSTIKNEKSEIFKRAQTPKHIDQVKATRKTYNTTSPLRKALYNNTQQVNQTSPLARGCSNVYDISFDCEDDLDTLSQVGDLKQPIQLQGQ
ncbi:hypothetical protein SS50377_28607 [Spironucleus salmonicida]|nr:hypothetical protein SS50377_28718 [Spironucleus salmonicida]KAH0569651.1 hypothetical protein SS50377_28607 [Spironucleus salmonicida]